MVLNLILVISDPTAVAARLCAVLNADGMPSRQVAPSQLLAGWSAVDGVPDLLLVSAAMDAGLVRRVEQRIRQTTNRSPTVVMFSNAEVGDLEDHIRGGDRKSTR